MMAAWFQSITSENGSSHPLLSMTGTQAACGHRAAVSSSPSSPPTPWPSLCTSFGEATWQRTPEATAGQPKCFQFSILGSFRMHWKVGFAQTVAFAIWCLRCQTRAELFSAADGTLENLIQNDGLPCCFVSHLARSNFPSFYSMLVTTLQKIQIVFNSSPPFPWRSKFSILFGINFPNRGNCTNTTCLSSPVLKKIIVVCPKTNKKTPIHI